jgi:hypothetical protein
MDIHMMMVNDALKGRITTGRSKRGNLPDLVTLTFHGSLLYELQGFLEEEAVKADDYFKVRWLVLLAEELRSAVDKATGGSGKE